LRESSFLSSETNSGLILPRKGTGGGWVMGVCPDRVAAIGSLGKIGASFIIVLLVPATDDGV
jgi:hypothetical protein